MTVIAKRGHTRISSAEIGAIIKGFVAEHLRTLKGCRPSTIRSYKDALRLYLRFVAQNKGRKLPTLGLSDMTLDSVRLFLEHLEKKRKNGVSTRNQRLAVLKTFFNFLGERNVEMLDPADKIFLIPMKRCPPPETAFLEKEDIRKLFTSLPETGRNALRDRTLFLFLYNTGARVQEAADLRVNDIDWDRNRVRLHGKGDKWRVCPLWAETLRYLRLLRPAAPGNSDDGPVFASEDHRPLTRSGIYKIVRRRAEYLDPVLAGSNHRVSPHIFRHTAAVHLLESGVELNVIREWLGHVSLDTTNRYAEINIRTKKAALQICETALFRDNAPVRFDWHTDRDMLNWLESL